MPPSIRSCRVPTLLLTTLALLAPATRALAQSAAGGGRSQRYAFVVGIPGVAAGTQTLYAVDDVNDALFAFEYSARSRGLVARAAADLRPVAARLLARRTKGREVDESIVRRYTLVAGIEGVARGTQTLYLADDARQLLYVYEYHARSHALTARSALDLFRYATAAAKNRARRPGSGPVPRYALATGLAGTARNTQTLYVADDCRELLFAFEYSASTGAATFRSVADLRGLAEPLPQYPLPRARDTRIPVPRYTLVTGLAGNARGSETLYILGDAQEALLVLEYRSRSRALVPRQMADLHGQANQIIKARFRP